MLLSSVYNVEVMAKNHCVPKELSANILLWNRHHNFGYWRTSIHDDAKKKT